MRYLTYILILFLISCSNSIQYTGNAGTPIELECVQDGKMRRQNVYCLRDFLIGEDAGGNWYQIGILPQDISPLLIGDNPCIEWSDKACGPYHLMYVVGDACCRDTAYVTPLKCCLTGTSNCN
jgi:hypothetical protein